MFIVSFIDAEAGTTLLGHDNREGFRKFSLQRLLTGMVFFKKLNK